MDSVEHFSIPVDDIERARAFYAAVFGFEYEPWDDSRGLLRTGGGIDGDLHLRRAVAHPTVTVYVDDLDASLRAVIANGGSQLGEIEAVTAGTRSVSVRDSEGNALDLFAGNAS
ncbi:VOC family protein [Microbacteriaceae bacterium VKM Ac-2854]|nr:VOC family protein [Microbacteriaceae bacterium VKM Ac-2854]